MVARGIVHAFLFLLCGAGVGSQFHNCTDEDIGNGRCDVGNNNKACLYDGGDCCQCTCVHGLNYRCGIFGFTCKDPGVVSSDDHICMESSSTNMSCPTEIQSMWIVENTAQAQALAKSIRCSVGPFNVTWKGTVAIDETISILHGTSLSVTSNEGNATITCDGQIRLFTVVNASLHLRDIILSHGYTNYGGAIAASRSRLSFHGVSFNNNTASNGGGAMFLSRGTVVSFDGETSFLNNTASDGGALYMTGGSSASWAGRITAFSLSTATSGNGGALCMMDGSRAIWDAVSHFVNNSAFFGGSVYVAGGSTATWNASSVFSANVTQGSGGAVYVTGGSTASWSTPSSFSDNSAQYDGGAVYSNDYVTLSWRGSTSFAGNTAENGGAVFVANGVSTKFAGKTSFTSNSALLNGGAVGSKKSDETFFSLEGATRFVKNTCGASGGGMALVQSLTVFFVSNNITYSQNHANISGGAVFITDTSIGPVFRNVNFVENSAQIGGGVHTTGSGTEMDNPTTFDGCSFIGNIAQATGGAVDIGSGQGIFNNTLFKGNEARAGGALRLGGSASIDNCLFEDNISELGEGPTVSNVGYISSFMNSIFQDNAFNCDPQEFLDFDKVCSILFRFLRRVCPSA